MDSIRGNNAGGRPLEGRHVLVVDDQPSIRGVLRVALEDAGATVSVAEDGAAGLDAAIEQQPHVILLDIGMPVMDAWEVLQALARTPRGQHIPVVLQAAANDFESFERARKLGVAAFLSKPFRLGEVVETCRRVILGARPLLGRDAPEDTPTFVEVLTDDARPPRRGKVLDRDPRGVQVELEHPLPLRTRVRLRFDGETETVEAEVRWATSAHGAICHGMVLKQG